MKKLTAFISAVFIVSTLSAASAWAEDPDSDVLDRHAVWTKTKDVNTGPSSGSQKKAEGKTTKDDQAEIKIRIEDRPWARVG